MIESSLTWRLEKIEDGMRVVFNGHVGEEIDFTPLANLRGKVIFDLAGVSRLTSEGIRRWVNFVRGLDKVDELIFIRCSVSVVTQVNMIPSILGGGSIRSFYAPYYCAQSGAEEDRLLTVDDIADPLDPPTFPCEGGTLELDDIPERFFAFMIQK